MNRRSSMVIGIAIASALSAVCGPAGAQTSACAPRSDGEGKRVEEAGFVALGGLEQWVTIRGDE